MSRNSRRTKSKRITNRSVEMKILVRKAGNKSKKSQTRIKIEAFIPYANKKRTATYLILPYTYASKTYASTPGGGGNGGPPGGGGNGELPPFDGKKLIILGEIQIKNQKNQSVDSKALIGVGINKETINFARLQLDRRSATHPTSDVLNNLGCANALLAWYTYAEKVLQHAIDAATTDDERTKNARAAAQNNLEVIHMFLNPGQR